MKEAIITENNKGLKPGIKKTRGKFFAMASCYSLGVFNDNFFKQAAILLAIAAGLHRIQGYATIIFTLPYIVFAAPAGWLADRYSKGKIVIYAKFIEMLAMILGAIGIITGSWTMMLAMVFTMGLQSCIFSPALNGSIPELYPESYVLKANSILKVVITIMILGGIATAGWFLDIKKGILISGVPYGNYAVAVAVLTSAVCGYIISLFVPQKPAANPEAKFPWRSLWDTFLDLKGTRKDSLLFTVIIARAYIWFVGTLQILIINKMGIDQFGFSNSITGSLVAFILMGIAVGGLLAGLFLKGKNWHRVLPKASFGLFIICGSVSLIPLFPESSTLTISGILFVFIGIAGGLFLVPCESFVQIRPPAHRKGAIISASNCSDFISILLAGIAANIINDHILPTNGFLIVSILSIIASVWLSITLRKERVNQHHKQ